jgi:hypothetical protein
MQYHRCCHIQASGSKGTLSAKIERQVQAGFADDEQCAGAKATIMIAHHNNLAVTAIESMRHERCDVMKHRRPNKLKLRLARCADD